ncbi:MAG: glycosyltransferase, partial [Muribaculaceae bacterium]|nr:glycosyltransferase [Muribaculaceae bacterium]
MRILHFIYGLKVGGAETFIASILGRLNHDEYEFGFVLQDGDITNRFIADYIRKHNCEVFVVPRFPAGVVGQYRALLKILREHRYDYVHIHMNAVVNPVPLVVARRGCGATKFILHSHNTDSARLLGRLLHSVNSRLLVNRSIIKLACSDVAGKWMFRNMAFQLVDNAVDVGRFTYNGANRLAIRNEFMIDCNAAVIGSVGRFVSQKNHRFMVEWFADYCKTHTNAVLLLVGDGPLLPDIKRLAEEKNVADRVVFTGIRTDTPAVLSAIDCFIMPSH